MAQKMKNTMVERLNIRFNGKINNELLSNTIRWIGISDRYIF